MFLFWGGKQQNERGVLLKEKTTRGRYEEKSRGRGERGKKGGVCRMC